MMKERIGNSVKNNLLISPYLKRNVFHIRVKAQKMRMNCISAETPMKTQIMIEWILRSISPFVVTCTSCLSLAKNIETEVPMRSRVKI